MLTVRVYLIVSPEFPDRVMVSQHAPSRERTVALIAQGCEIHYADVNIHADIERSWRTTSGNADAQPLPPYLHHSVRSPDGRHGEVTRVGSDWVDITWEATKWCVPTVGTFKREAFERKLAAGELFDVGMANKEPTVLHGLGTEEPTP